MNPDTLAALAAAARGPVEAFRGAVPRASTLVLEWEALTRR